MSTVIKSAQIVSSTFLGRSGTGSISVPGLVVGDRLIWLHSTGYTGADINLNGFNYMEVIISVDDQIQQTDNGNYTTWTFDAIFVRDGT